jgi:manganese transport protein
VSFALLGLHSSGRRRFDATVAALLAVVTIAFLYETLHGRASGHAVAAGFVPHFRGNDSVLLATGIVGATVMPHAIYLHSALTQERFAGETGPIQHTANHTTRRHLLRVQRADVFVAMGIAGIVNMAMVVAAGTWLFGLGGKADTLEGAYHAFGQRAGSLAGTVFAVALLASGLASSSVAMYAGQAIMQGFLRRQIPMALRRLASVIPALAVLAIGHNPTQALVISQVVLSFGIPFALVPLILLTRQPELMGGWVNRTRTTVLAGLAAVVIILLNVLLISLAI